MTGDRLSKEMSLTPADFLRLLPAAVDGLPWSMDGLRAVVGDADGGVCLTLTPRPPRRFGPVALPVMTVDFRFQGWTAAKRAAFIERFDHYFRRGGG